MSVASPTRVMLERRDPDGGSAPESRARQETALAHGEFIGRVRRRVDLAQATCVELEDHARAPMPEHTHAEAYVCVCLRGTYRSGAAGWRESRDTGVLFHPAGTRHRDHFLSPGRCLNVSLRSAWLDESFESRLPELPSATYAPTCIGNALRTWREVAASGVPEAHAIEEGLVLVLSEFAPRVRSRRRTAPPWIASAKRAISDDFEGTVRIGALAARLGVHPVVLARGFQRHAGCSPLEYLRSVRVRRATRLLADEAFPLAEIAARSGFADQAQFTRAFARVTGWTPGAMRRVLRGP